MIIPVIIYRERKSDKELHEEMERERYWRKLRQAEEEKRERLKREEELREFMKRMEERERAEKEYHEAERKNPWDYQFLPEGWSIFGQTYIPTINDYGYTYAGYEDDLNGGYND